MQSNQIPTIGYLRLSAVLAVIPVSKSTWWAGVKSGRYPQPSRSLGARITAWRAEDIRALCEAAAPKAVA
jgi:prophage regulatory protein